MATLFACIDPKLLERHARSLIVGAQADELDGHPRDA